MEQEKFQEPGHKLEAEIVSTRGHCGWGHKVGNKFPVRGHNNAGMCGFLYHDAFSYFLIDWSHVCRYILPGALQLEWRRR